MPRTPIRETDEAECKVSKDRKQVCTKVTAQIVLRTSVCEIQVEKGEAAEKEKDKDNYVRKFQSRWAPARADKVERKCYVYQRNADGHEPHVRH